MSNRPRRKPDANAERLILRRPVTYSSGACRACTSVLVRQFGAAHRT